MRTKELYAGVAARVDTQGTKINAAETSRVAAELFNEIADKIRLSHITELEAVEWFTKELKKRLQD